MAHLVVSDELAGHSDLQCSHCALDRIRRVTCTALGFCISENSFARVKIRPARPAWIVRCTLRLFVRWRETGVWFIAFRKAELCDYLHSLSKRSVRSAYFANAYNVPLH